MFIEFRLGEAKLNGGSYDFSATQKISVGRRLRSKCRETESKSREPSLGLVTVRRRGLNS